MEVHDDRTHRVAEWMRVELGAAAAGSSAGSINSRLRALITSARHPAFVSISADPCPGVPD
jgi:hypothetical protein